MINTDGDIGHRLRGARVAAGFIFLVDAARHLGVHQVTLRHAETGLRPPSASLIESICGLYEVNQTFILDGIVQLEREALAQRLAKSIEEAEQMSSNEDADNPSVMADEYNVLKDRLIEMRLASGHETASAAAKAHGWNKSQYWQHEQGTYRIPTDRMIGHALSMGARPEWALTGQGKVLEDQALNWRAQDRVQRESIPGPAR